MIVLLRTLTLLSGYWKHFYFVFNYPSQLILHNGLQHSLLDCSALLLVFSCYYYYYLLLLLLFFYYYYYYCYWLYSAEWPVWLIRVHCCFQCRWLSVADHKEVDSHPLWSWPVAAKHLITLTFITRTQSCQKSTHEIPMKNLQNIKINK